MFCETHPVANSENHEVDGLALCGDSVFKDKIERAKVLRQRQVDYVDSLPDNLEDAVRSALKVLQPDMEEYPSKLDEVQQNIAVLSETLAHGDYDNTPYLQNAMAAVAFRSCHMLMDVMKDLDHACQILKKPPCQ